MSFSNIGLGRFLVTSLQNKWDFWFSNKDDIYQQVEYLFPDLHFY